ncbi:MAG: hypothetical protein ACO1N0_01195 [Fluviicola sp.]
MDKYNHLTNLFRSHFYQTVFEDFNSIDEIILDYKKDSSKNDWNLLVKDIELITNEEEKFILDFFDRTCDGIGINSKREAIEVLEKILQLLK